MLSASGSAISDGDATLVLADDGPGHAGRARGGPRPQADRAAVAARSRPRPTWDCQRRHPPHAAAADQGRLRLDRAPVQSAPRAARRRSRDGERAGVVHRRGEAPLAAAAAATRAATRAARDHAEQPERAHRDRHAGGDRARPAACRRRGCRWPSRRAGSAPRRCTARGRRRATARPARAFSPHRGRGDGRDAWPAWPQQAAGVDAGAALPRAAHRLGQHHEADRRDQAVAREPHARDLGRRRRRTPGAARGRPAPPRPAPRARGRPRSAGPSAGRARSAPRARGSTRPRRACRGPGRARGPRRSRRRAPRPISSGSEVSPSRIARMCRAIRRLASRWKVEQRAADRRDRAPGRPRRRRPPRPPAPRSPVKRIGGAAGPGRAPTSRPTASASASSRRTISWWRSSA